MVSWSPAEESLRAWDTRSGAQLWRARVRLATDICLPRIGSLVVVVGQNSVQAFDLATGRSLYTIQAKGRPRFVSASTITGNVASGPWQDSKVLVIDPRSGDTVDVTEVPEKSIACNLLEASLVLVTQTGQLIRQTLANPLPREVMQISQMPIEAALVSPDGSRVVFATETELVIADAVAGKRLFAIPVDRYFSKLFALSGDNRLLAVADTTRPLTIYNGQSGRVLGTLDKYRSRVSALSFGDSPRLLITAHQCDSIFSWRLDSYDFSFPSESRTEH